MRRQTSTPKPSSVWSKEILPKTRTVIVPAADSAEGYHLAIQNGQRLFSASRALIADSASIALGLAQIGQEEIGKSLSLLAAIGMRPVDHAWKWFWRDWRNHRTKAHRAYLYEIIHPQRIELRGEGGRVYDGGPLRDTIVQEKEAAFYLDYDAAKGQFVGPLTGVKTEEAWSRLGTLAYLGLTASAVHDALFEDDAKFRLTTFSEIAFRLCTEALYQEDMPGILAEFESRSERHGSLVASLGTHLDSIRLTPRGEAETS